MSTINESHVEEAALSWLAELGFATAHGQEIAPGESRAERDLNMPTATHDALLSKLLSGEIRVGEAEKTAIANPSS